MKALDQVVRDRIAPVLQEAGFRRRGRRFTYESATGRVEAAVTHYSLGRHDAEFHLDLSVTPLIASQFAMWRSGDQDRWLIDCRITPDAPSLGIWELDLADESAGERLSSKLAQAVPDVMAMLDPENLLTPEGRLARSVGNLRIFPTYGESIVVALLMSTRGPSVELDALLTSFDAAAADDPAIELLHDTSRFVRAYLAGRIPTSDGAPTAARGGLGSIAVPKSCTVVLASVEDEGQLAWVGEPTDVRTALIGDQPWFVGAFDHDVFWRYQEILTRLVEQTRWPALLGQTINGDFLGVVGLCPDGSRWSGAVDADAAAMYRNEGETEGYADVIPAYDPTTRAIDGATDWARAAGLEPKADRLHQLFDARELTRPAYLHLGEFLEAIGLADA